MIRKSLKYLGLVFLAVAAAYLAVLLFVSPVPPAIGVADVDPSGWESGEPLSLTIQNPDSTKLYDIRILLRCDERYDLDTLTVGLTVAAPDSTVFTERIDLALPAARLDRKGAFEASIPYRTRSRLSLGGIYTFTFTHSLPAPPCGISAIGIILE